MATTMVHVRIDEKTKQKATKALSAMGISVSDAVRILLVRVAAAKALAFDVKIPNATTFKQCEPSIGTEANDRVPPQPYSKN